MTTSKSPNSELIGKFWETVPLAWFQTRARIRGVAAERFSLTVEQFQVLRRIRRGFNSVSTIAEDGHTSRPSVSQAVDVLVRRGLVARQTDAVDRRHIHLSLTEEGERTLAVIYDETSLWLEAQFARLSPEEREALLTLLDLLPKAFRPG